MRRVLAVVVGVVLFTSIAGCRAENLVENGGLEGPAGAQNPPAWEKLIVSTPATFALDDSIKHAGRTSGRISAAESTRSYFRTSGYIDVAPGEEILGSAWVRETGIEPEKGAAILIAEFSDFEGNNDTVAKFNTADLKKPGQWQHIGGKVKVPALATRLRVRAGFSYAKGTCWWDDVNVRAVKPLVCRIDLPDARLTPAMKSLPVSILNRIGTKGPVTLRMQLDKTISDHRVQLSGERVQRVELPLKVAKPGKVDVAIDLVDGAGNELFAEARNGVVPLPLAIDVPSPTHWCVEDGPAKVEMSVQLAVPDEALPGATWSAHLEDAAGRSFAPIESPLVKNGTWTSTLVVPDLPVGEYKLVAEFKPRSGKPIRVERPWHVIPRRLAEVKINQAGFPEYDGKPIFPLGIFNGGKFEEQGKAGFTVTHAYNAARIEPNWPEADANTLRFLEQSQKNGDMKMLLMVPMKEVFRGDFDAVRRRVRTFRNHPALLAWDEEEGFARGDFKPDTLKRLKQIIAEEDPHHPFMVGDPRDVIGHMPPDRKDFFPIADMDMGMWWWYPLPFKKPSATQKAAALEGEEEQARWDEMVPPAFLINNLDIGKPLWVGLQAYNKGKDSRFPTPLEYRSQAYVAIIAGAKGLMWYGGSVTGGIFAATTEPAHNRLFAPATKPAETHWDYLQKLATELHGLSDVLMSPTMDTPKVSPEGALISVCIRQSANRTVMLSANRGPEKVDVTFASPKLSSGSAKLISEDRHVSVSNGELRDTFAPYEVHVYELPKTN